MKSPKHCPFKHYIATAILFSLASGMVAANDRPNILFIFADDQSYETIASLGNDEVRTPNLDRLVASGTSFVNTYNMGGWSGAICVASRTMLNTGRMVWRAQAVDNKQEMEAIAKRGESWAQLLKSKGYETYMTGKWHVKIDPARFYDHVAHERPGMPRDTKEGYNRPIEGQIDAWSPFDQSRGGFWEGGKHWSEVVADDAESFLANAAKSDAPFFMYLAFNAPHDPRQSPKRFVDMYPQEEVKVPLSYMPEYPFKDEIGCGDNLRDARLAPFPRTEYSVRVNRQEYYAIISHMDEQVGRILEALKKTGKMDNTYIFFSADHGLACGNHGLLGKQNMYEHSLKPPLIVAGPDIPKNQKRDAMVYLQDIMATSLDLAGVSKPGYVDFNSLLPLIANPQKQSAYDSIYGCYLADLQRMVRRGNLKLIVYPKAGVVRLYDLDTDPLELRDLAGDPSNWKTIRSLFGDLLGLQEEMDDKLDLKAVFPELVL